MNSNKLSAKDKNILYDYLCLYEYDLKDKAGSFDLNCHELNSFLKMNRIYLGALNKSEQKKSKKYSYTILYAQRRGDKVSKDDKVHHLLRHIRNSIAHGLIKKRKGNIVSLQDKGKQGQETMQGQIDINLLYALLNQLIKTNKQ